MPFDLSYMVVSASSSTKSRGAEIGKPGKSPNLP